MVDAPPQSIEIHLGGSQVVHLPGQGIGGYLWTAEVLRGTVRVEELAPDGASPSLIGGAIGGDFRVIGEQPGESLVRFVYRRPWETEIQSTHDLMVRVID